MPHIGTEVSDDNNRIFVMTPPVGKGSVQIYQRYRTSHGWEIAMVILPCELAREVAARLIVAARDDKDQANTGEGKS